MSTSNFAEKVTLACGDFYLFSAKGGKNQSFYSQIVKKAGTAADLDIDIQILPWKRAIILTKQDKLDGIACSRHMKERKSWLSFTKTDFFVAEGGLFVRKDSQIQSADLANLKGKTIGVMSGSSAVQFLETYGKDQVILKEFYNENDALKMLHGKRFDAMYMMKIAAKRLLRDKFPEMFGACKYLGTLDSFALRPAIGLKYPKVQELAHKLDADYQIIKKALH